MARVFWDARHRGCRSAGVARHDPRSCWSGMGTVPVPLPVDVREDREGAGRRLRYGHFPELHGLLKDS